MPIFNGFQFSALISPGQNYAKDNSDYAYGDYFQCSGSSAPCQRRSNFPGTGGAVNGNIGGNGCTDGSYGNAYSAALNYKNGPFTATRRLSSCTRESTGTATTGSSRARLPRSSSPTALRS